MEAIWVLVTAIAPIAWGSTYFVTHELLPPDAPLWGSVLRALPAGLLLLLVGRRLPRGRWWWRSLVLGVLNVGAFFLLIYIAAILLPASIASTVMASSPITIMLAAWLVAGQRPRVLAGFGAVFGVAGVVLLVAGGGDIDLRGVAASVAGLLCTSLGYALATRWSGEVDLVSSTAWQLLIGGLLLLPAAVLVEGAPPALTGVPQLLAYVYVAVVATAIAYVAWFAGLRHLSSATVGLVGLLNPVTGVLLGVAVGGELFAGSQILGLALVAAAIALGLPWRSRVGARNGSRGRSLESSTGIPRMHSRLVLSFTRQRTSPWKSATRSDSSASRTTT